MVKTARLHNGIMIRRWVGLTMSCYLESPINNIKTTLYFQSALQSKNSVWAVKVKHHTIFNYYFWGGMSKLNAQSLIQLANYVGTRKTKFTICTYRVSQIPWTPILQLLVAPCSKRQSEQVRFERLIKLHLQRGEDSWFCSNYYFLLLLLSFLLLLSTVWLTNLISETKPAFFVKLSHKMEHI